MLQYADKVICWAQHVSTYVERITIFSIVSEAVHHEADPHVYSELECFKQLGRMLQVKIVESIGEEFDVQIKHVDIPCLMIGKNAFVFPRCSGASFAPEKQSDEGSQDVQMKVVMNAHMISSVSRILDVEPEAFCLGALSEKVARGLSFIPAHESSSGKKAAFCIVDRALDTMSPSIHSQYFIQQMMVQNYSYKVETDDSRMLEVRPSVFHPADVESLSYLEFLMSKTDREAMLFIRKWLKEAIRVSNMKFTGRLKPGAPSIQDLEALSAVLESDPAASRKHASLLQIVELACKCLKDAKKWEESKKLEDIAKLSAEDGPESFCGFILDELSAAGKGISQDHRVFTAVKYLLLGCYWMKIHPHLRGKEMLSVAQRAAIANSLAEASALCIHTWQEEGNLSDSNLEKEMPWLSKDIRNNILSSAGDIPTIPLQEVCIDVVETICNLPSQYQTAGEYSSTADQETLVIKLIDDIIAGRNIPIMKHIGTSIAGLLKSGLGKIGLQQHSPGEYETVVIFVLGGISINEISQTRGYVDQCIARMQAEGRKMPRIIIGASSILTTPEIMLKSIFS